jgi:hypothetical protein
MRKILTLAAMLSLASSLTGCQTQVGHKIGDVFIGAWEATHDAGTNAPVVTSEPPVATNAPVVVPDGQGEATGALPVGCRFVGGANVGGWPVTAKLQAAVSVKRYTKKDEKTGKVIDCWNMPVTLKHDKVNVWPANGDGLNANPWIIAEFGGQWYAGNWEWIRRGQTVKDMSGKTFGSHVKASPFPGDWNPAKGQKVGFMVSGLSRGGAKGAQERTDVVWITWP